MVTPINVAYQHFEPNDAVRGELQELADRLAGHGHEVTDGRIVVEAAHQHGERQNVEIRVELNVPRKGKIIAKRQAEWPAPRGLPSVVQAANECVRNAEHQLQEHREKMRVPQDAKALAHQALQGRIARLNPTVENGFIEMRDGPDRFFSAAVLEDAKFDELEEGDEVFVTVAEGEGPYGPQASSVSRRAHGA